MKGKEGGGKDVGGGGGYGASMTTTCPDEGDLHDLLTAPLIPGGFQPLRSNMNGGRRMSQDRGGFDAQRAAMAALMVNGMDDEDEDDEEMQ